jgi:uncharacterized damage-inducible protein DinB
MLNKEAQLVDEIKNNAIYRMDENSRMIGIGLRNIDENDIWMRPNGISNSIGNQILHLCGNMSQYLIASLGKKQDVRERDLEFATREGFSKAQLIGMLLETTLMAKSIILNCTLEDLLEKREVQGFNFTGAGCIIHAVEHYSYHTGQIAFWVKQLKNKSLGFYDGVDLNIKNKEC